MKRWATWLSAATLVSGAALATGTPAHAGDSAYTKTTLHFAVTTGPNGDVGCDIVGDLYLPAGASAAAPVPVVLATNGFGGSKDDFSSAGPAFAGKGYAFLAYSGLGFGGSTCKITLDDRDWDGKAGSQLVSFLGGAPGIAYLDAAHTQAYPRLTSIVHDAKDHKGIARQYDPRLGMIGGSYGGQIQFAISGIDARVDAITPTITWNDLSYSLDPNNISDLGGVQSSTPGAVKLGWATGFSALGVVDGLQQIQGQPTRMIPCPNFADWVCPALAYGAVHGFLDPPSLAALKHASVNSFMSSIKIPTLLIQGETDTLFNLNEATATYKALKAQGTTVKMIWRSSGHSGGTIPGETNYGDLTPGASYIGDRTISWFNRYLKGLNADTGPNFAYFRDWVAYTGSAAPAFATSATFPVGSPTRFYLGTDTLSRTAPLLPGSQTLITPPGGLPTNSDPIDALGSYAPVPLPEYDVPGTFATWNSAALTAPLNVAGSPVLHLAVSDPVAALTQIAGPDGQLVLFIRVEDVAPDGTSSMIKLQIAPVRVPDVTKPFTVTMPAIVHQFAAGHKIRLIVSGGSTNYRGNTTPSTVTITGGAGQTLDLPTTN